MAPARIAGYLANLNHFNSAELLVGTGDFWILGLILGLFFFVVYILIGVPWLAFMKI